jgi:2-hydroxy-3-keto-5-methylthiopentenyl-1-phosphate phosphatase
MTKVLVQCDFDGTITNDDTSFALLDTFAQGDWQKLLRQYKEHKISVGEFNSNAFAMVKASKHTLLEFLKKEGKAQIRPGFRDFVSYCARKNFRLVITSNGLILSSTTLRYTRRRTPFIPMVSKSNMLDLTGSL